MYTPAHIRATSDLSEFYEKAPHEMSRYELQELEKIMMLKENEELVDEKAEVKEVLDENGEPLSKLDILRGTKVFKINQAEVAKI